MKQYHFTIAHEGRTDTVRCTAPSLSYAAAQVKAAYPGSLAHIDTQEPHQTLGEINAETMTAADYRLLTRPQQQPLTLD